MSDYVTRESFLEVDFCVVGGGLAGTCAAIAAARQGLTVALVHNRPVLGGNSSSEIRVWVCGATAHGNQRWARETGIIGELLEENQYRNPEGNPLYWDEVVLDAVRAEPNVTLLLNTDVRHVEVGADGRISSVTGWTMGSEQTVTITSTYVADCTGDGWLAAVAGARFRCGKEGRDEFGEDFAPPVATREFLGSTILFYTKDAGRPSVFVPPNSAKDITQTPILRTRTLSAGDNGAAYWWIEYGGHLDPVQDNAEIAQELRSVIYGIWDFIKNSGNFDAENLTLEWIGALPGKREYRRLLGDHTLTQSDVMDQVQFHDAVGFGGWSIDLHPVEGVYAESAGARQRFGRGLFTIPFRSLYSPDVDNLLFAGRNISATHVAFGATRVMATCAVQGEAIGTAAALAHETGRSWRDLARRPHLLQQRLLREDAALLGIANSDAQDLIRRAVVTSDHSATILERPPHPEGRIALDRPCAMTLPGQLDLEKLELYGAGGRTVAARLVAGPSALAPIPTGEVLAMGRIHLPSEPGWAPVQFEGSVSFNVPADVFFVVEPAEGCWLAHSAEAAPWSLGMVNAADFQDQNVSIDADSPLLQWPTRSFRGRTLAHRLVASCRQVDASAVQGGFQRPYGGPHMWISRPLAEGPAFLQVTWPEPQDVGWLDLVFDAQVDTELNNLHHHRTPDRVMPGIARDFSVLIREESGAWTMVREVQDNRRRHVRLRIDKAVAQLEVRTERTHGAPEARIVSLRAYAPDVPGGEVSYAM